MKLYITQLNIKPVVSNIFRLKLITKKAASEFRRLPVVRSFKKTFPNFKLSPFQLAEKLLTHRCIGINDIMLQMIVYQSHGHVSAE